MTPDRLAIAARSSLRALKACAAALAFAVSAGAAAADTPSDDIMPRVMPDSVAELRLRPAFGPSFTPLAPGQQPLTDALLANYVERQHDLRSFNGFSFGEDGTLNEHVLLGYIARGSLGGGNTALDAIASFTTPQPTLTPEMLASYAASSHVSTAKRLETAERERHCLAKAIYHEARGEPQQGQMAVANIIVNRANSSRYPDSLCGVIYQNADRGRYRCQFTFACDGRSDTATERAAWSRSQSLAAKVYAQYAQGRTPDILPRSALFYHTTAVRPNWSQTYNRVAQIGAHIFYSPN